MCRMNSFWKLHYIWRFPWDHESMQVNGFVFAKESQSCVCTLKDAGTTSRGTIAQTLSQEESDVFEILFLRTNNNYFLKIRLYVSTVKKRNRSSWYFEGCRVHMKWTILLLAKSKELNYVSLLNTSHSILPLDDISLSHDDNDNCTKKLLKLS